VSPMVRRLNILVVEDHADSARALSRLLTGEGHTVRHADGYAATMQLAHGGDRFDLLLIDLGLPDGDGCDLLKEVRELHSVPAIAITGHGMEPDVRRCRQAGFEDHVLKPIALPRLIGAINRLTGGPAVPLAGDGGQCPANRLA
jgi:CheY-like chemotaxis protein